MRTPSPAAVRGGLVGVFALLLAALVGPTAWAQFRPPTFPQPRPPIIPPIPQPPRITFPEPPRINFPEPRLPGLGGPGIPGMGGPGIGGGGTIIEHTCGKCRAVMARNNDSMGYTGSCPSCGLSYTFGRAFDDGRARPNPGAGFVPPAAPQPQPFNPPVQPDPVFVPASTPNPNPVFGSEPTAPPLSDRVTTSTAGTTPTPAAPKSSNKTLYLVGGIVLGLLVILGMVLGVMYANANAKRTARPASGRGRVRRSYD